MINLNLLQLFFIMLTRNTTCYNNSNDLLHLQVHVENFNIFGSLYITQSNICDGVFIAKRVSRQVYSKKSSVVDARFGSKYVSTF